MTYRALSMFLVFSTLGESADPWVYNVCEVLSHLHEFSCRAVQLRARLVTTGEGTWMMGENCTKPIEVNGVRFKDFIAVTWPSSPVAGCRLGWADDEESVRKIRQALGRDDDNSKVRTYATIEGVIETRDPPFALTGKKPGWPLGFGHLGMAPAQIIIKRVVRLEVQKVSAPTGQAESK